MAFSFFCWLVWRSGNGIGHIKKLSYVEHS